jgi:hypothetical protein
MTVGDGCIRRAAPHPARKYGPAPAHSRRRAATPSGRGFVVLRRYSFGVTIVRSLYILLIVLRVLFAHEHSEVPLGLSRHVVRATTYRARRHAGKVRHANISTTDRVKRRGATGRRRVAAAGRRYRTDVDEAMKGRPQRHLSAVCA